MMTASRESVAYREYEDRFMPAPVQKSSLRAVPDKRRRRKTAVRPGLVACVGLIIAAAAYILFCHMQLTGLTAEISAQSEMLDELTAESVSLANKQKHSLNMDDVEAYAVNTLGMVKMDNSQIEYVELVNPDQVTVADSGVSLDALLGGLARSFSAIVEYIR